ncbi:MAG: recombinase family protein [Sphingobacteriales bacterium]|nr:recombinase family protein [Sphingobacteriales bacterium]
MNNVDLIKGLFKTTGNPNEAHKKNAVIYTRVSTKEQAENNDSLDTQKKYCRQLAGKEELTVLEEFGGTYESAKNDGRKEFMRMLDFIKKSPVKISYIIVYSLDRFSRSGGQAIALAEQLRNMEVHIISCTQPTDVNTSSGTFQQSIQLLFSKWDNDQRKEKVIAGMKEKLLDGYWMGKAPIGYDHIRTKDGQQLVINAVGEIIRKAFLLKADQGLTNYEISQSCKALGRFINEKRLFDIFRNPFYCGYIRNRLLENEVIKGKHPILVSEEVFLKANNIGVAQPQNYISKPTDQLFPLKRFVKCSKCGTTWVGYTVTGKKATYYKCNQRGCKCNRNAAILHEEFKGFLSTYVIPEKYIEPLKAQLNLTFKSMNKDNEVSKILLKTKLNEAEENLYKVEERYALGKIEDETVYCRIRGKFQDEIGGINAELRKLNSTLSNLDNFIHYSVKLSSKLNTMWGSGNFELKQGLQNLMFPEGVTYDFQKSEYRTCKSNWVFASIAGQARVFQNEEGGSTLFLPGNSALVVLTGIEPVSKV